MVDKILLVTGGLSEIGLEVINNMITNKKINKLILCEKPDKREKLNQLRHMILEQFNNSLDIDMLFFDANDKNEAEQQLLNCKTNFDYFLNLVGLNIFNSVLDVTEDEWDLIVDTNLKSSFFLSQAVSKKMVKSKTKGSIVLLASQHGVVANGLRAPYCASKAGVIQLAKSLGLELSSYGIRVNCVSPTYILDEKSKEFLLNKEVKKEYLSKIPLKKYALPSDIANACYFLLSEESAMITGQNIIIDGGYTIW
ncbi:SDR family oxidoreductase [Listeria monocytogenes]|nr:SDR family oxidoreductase [Listeria monocytogenes]EAD0856247.1 SDR family oxidoreductase [Listeria monocytogenes]EAF2002559.1 SDR family oxidoreductase [Listeria monocytogenes]